jgi:hypothetical protein
MEASPKWVQRFRWFVGLPCWLACAALIISGQALVYRGLLVITFGGFFASAVIGAIYARRSNADGLSPGLRWVALATVAIAGGIAVAIWLGFIPNHAP